MAIARLSKFWSHSVTIHREVAVDDGFMGSTRTREKKDWNVPCRISTHEGRGGGRLMIEFSGKSYTVTHRLICDADVDLQVGDKLREETSRTVFMVLDLNPIYRGRVAHHIEAMVQRVDN